MKNIWISNEQMILGKEDKLPTWIHAIKINI
jgi:hypothetical protein